MVRMHQHKYRVLLGSLIKMLHIRRNFVDMRLFWQSAEWIRLFHSIKFEFTCPLLLRLRLQPSLLHSPNYPILHSLGWTCRDIVWVVQHSRCCKSMYDKLSDSWSYSLSRQCPWLLWQCRVCSHICAWGRQWCYIMLTSHHVPCTGSSIPDTDWSHRLICSSRSRYHVTITMEVRCWPNLR